jgi:tRNA-dihydrouridine synthase B
MFERTGCDLVLIGRGALGNPWLFAQVNARMRGEADPPPPGIDERLDVLRQEIALLLADKGPHTGFREARKHAAWYMTGLRGAAKLRRMCGAISSMEDVERVCLAACEMNP